MSVNIGKMGNFGKSSWNSKRIQYVEIINFLRNWNGNSVKIHPRNFIKISKVKIIRIYILGIHVYNTCTCINNA